jgi:hypothetical protein
MAAIKGTRPPNAGKGRRKGVPNKITRDVRAAVAELAQNNMHKLQGWLDRVAKKDPAKAADLFVRLLEYHIPKLARAEMAVTREPAKKHIHEFTTDELVEIILEEQPDLKERARHRVEESKAARTKEPSLGAKTR